MYFRKWPHPANFDFKSHRGITIRTASLGHDIFHVKARSPQWPKNYSQAKLQAPPKSKSDFSLKMDKSHAVTITGPDDATILSSPAGHAFGISGTRSLWVFERTPDQQFYGMGEKMLGFELSGKQTKFWNTDVFADFHGSEVFHDRPDPMYVSIPYLIIKRGNSFVGILVDNPQAVFMSTGANISIANQMSLGRADAPLVLIGTEAGPPDLYIIVGPSLAELTRKFQQLVGTTPLPPRWALGYHQCRWGYRSADDLDSLDRNFREHKIPCDGLWVDIDYMDGFRVFSWNKEFFPNPAKTFKQLRKNGRRVVPIIDPGVKKDDQYDVYQSGKRAKAYCRNAQSNDFVGLVWPGETVFPDFSTAAGRKWWTGHVKKFGQLGIEGAWIDMNDPSTGPVLNEDMRFNRGRDAHDTFHNQYATGMAEATRAGFNAAHPGKRTFVVSRSGSTGIGRYAAIWTGDNCSNYHYFRNCIAVSLNLALSGVPFNGPDIGGFAGDTNRELIRDWLRAGFLFPFCRNHTAIHTRQQEPWAFDDDTTELFRHYLSLRYKLRPYLYNLFVQQEQNGEAILRPLFYDFADTPELPLGKIDDQFMVGPWIMQAPILDEKRRTREVVLPGEGKWYSTVHGGWVDGGQRIRITPMDRETPLFIREGAIIPMQPGTPTGPDENPRTVVIHVWPKASGLSEFVHVFDDGETLAYRKGKRSELLIQCSTDNGVVNLDTKWVRTGYGKCTMAWVVYGANKGIVLNGKPVRTTIYSWLLAGREQAAVRFE